MSRNTLSNTDNRLFYLSSENLSSLASTGSRIAFSSAVCWIALGIESIVRPQQENYRDLVWMIPFTLTAITFFFVHVVQRSESAVFERVSFYLVISASSLTFLGNVGVLINQPILAALGFPWGAIIWMIGLIFFGIATWKAKMLPAYVGLSLILLEPGSILTGLALSPISPLHDRGGYSAGVEKGLALMLIGFGLRSLLTGAKASNAQSQIAEHS